LKGKWGTWADEIFRTTQSFWRWLGNFTKPIANWLGNFTKPIANWLGNFAKPIANWLGNFAKPIANWLSKLPLIGSTIPFLKGTWKGFVKFIRNPLKVMKLLGDILWKFTTKGLVGTTGSILKWLIKDIFQPAPGNWFDKAVRLFQRLFLLGGIRDVLKWISEKRRWFTPKGIKDALKGIGEKLGRLIPSFPSLGQAAPRPRPAPAPRPAPGQPTKPQQQ
jgi:hypothetical protein